mmetsp:Transcript_117969/g.328732  ORF Transcript_117969/g.328732 Transcript_117969/m.328732 type:complete len:167 (-) Transcript_117969:30-530(-)
MAKVRNTAAVVVGQDAGEELAQLRAQLVAARAGLTKLELDGMGERFDPSAAPNEVRSFKENMQRVAAEEARVREAKAELAELRASQAGADDVAAAANRAEAAALELQNYRDIILRQKSIKGFYIPAKPGYLAKLAEVRELEGRLSQLELAAPIDAGAVRAAVRSAP